MNSHKNAVVTSNTTRPSNPVIHPKPGDSIRRDGEIRFYLDDESSNMIQSMAVPTVVPDPPFAVQNYVGFNPDPESAQAKAANCMATLLSAQAMLRKYLNPVPRWATTHSLRVYPQAGWQLNAYYNRIGLSFFSGRNPHTGKVVHTCLSNDVITHEFFHAVYDALKPSLYNSPVVEHSAAHEGIADCGSILHAMNIDPVLTQMAMDIDAGRVSTIVSSVAPDLGHALSGQLGGLRDASVAFHYAKPETLPRLAPRDQLAREPHSFSRVLSSAFYAAIMAVYAKVKAPGGIGTREALIVARDVMAPALFQGVIAAPITVTYMNSLANSILTALATTPYLAEVTKVFSDWGLTSVQAASVIETEVRPTDKKVKVGDLDVLIREKTTTIILADEMILNQSDNPLYLCKVEVPNEEMLLAQSDGMAQVVDGSGEAEILDQVKLGLDYIWESDLVTLQGETVQDHHFFMVDGDGLLVRTGYNSDDGYFNNATLPGAPEFGKPWKADNNSGCCSGCKKTPDPVVKPPKLGCYVNERTGGYRTVRSCQVVRQKVC